jgi:DNA polymerase III subunit alpha
VLNKRTLENLILAGAFTSLGHTRKGLLAAYEQIVDAASARKKQEAAGQFSLFDGALDDAADDGIPLDDGVEIDLGEFDKTHLLKSEREMLGLYVSDHPLFGAERLLSGYTDTDCSDLREKDDGAGVTVGGVLTGPHQEVHQEGRHLPRRDARGPDGLGRGRVLAQHLPGGPRGPGRGRRAGRDRSAGGP